MDRMRKLLKIFFTIKFWANNNKVNNIVKSKLQHLYKMLQSSICFPSRNNKAMISMSQFPVSINSLFFPTIPNQRLIIIQQINFQNTTKILSKANRKVLFLKSQWSPEVQNYSSVSPGTNNSFFFIIFLPFFFFINFIKIFVSYFSEKLR